MYDSRNDDQVPGDTIDDAVREMRGKTPTRTQAAVAQTLDQRVWDQRINRSDRFANKSVAQARLPFFIPCGLLGNICHACGRMSKR